MASMCFCFQGPTPGTLRGKTLKQLLDCFTCQKQSAGGVLGSPFPALSSEGDNVPKSNSFTSGWDKVQIEIKLWSSLVGAGGISPSYEIASSPGVNKQGLTAHMLGSQYYGTGIREM